MQSIYLTIVLAPLAAAIVAGLFGRLIGRTGAHSVAIAGVALSCALSLYVLSPKPSPVAPTLGLLPCVFDDARFGPADAIADRFKRDASRWGGSGYVGFLDEDAIRKGSIRQAQLLEHVDRDRGAFDAYAYAGREQGTLRAHLAKRSTKAEALLHHVLLPRMGNAHALLERPIRVASAGVVVKSALLGQYVRDWFRPIRSRICDGRDRALQELLADGAPDSHAATLFNALPSIFLAAHGASVRWLEVPHA